MEFWSGIVISARCRGLEKAEDSWFVDIKPLTARYQATKSILCAFSHPRRFLSMFPKFYLYFSDKLLIGGTKRDLKARSLKRDVDLHQITY